jgi:hypothetical protein
MHHRRQSLAHSSHAILAHQQQGAKQAMTHRGIKETKDLIHKEGGHARALRRAHGRALLLMTRGLSQWVAKEGKP